MAKQNTYTIDCSVCGGLGSYSVKKEADRLAGAHAKGSDHTVIVQEEVPLPPRPMVGDRVRLKAKHAHTYAKACEAAGWSFFPDGIMEVKRMDPPSGPHTPSQGPRVFFDAPPFCYWLSDVELAWASVAERRAALKAAGQRV